jgi:hypothetical protein
MRIPVLLRQRAFFGRALGAGVFASVVALGMSACAGKKGELVVTMQTDMSLPKDVDGFRVRVLVNGAEHYAKTFLVDPSKPDSVRVPATLAVVEGAEPNQPVEVLVTALRGTEARTLNRTVTTIPDDHVAMLRVPIQWLCSDQVVQADKSDPDSVDTKCKANADGEDTACVAGTCQPVKTSADSLPTFDEKEVYGGGKADGGGGVCFPTEDCFDAGFAVPLEKVGGKCTVTLSAKAGAPVNFAVKTSGAEAGGICRGANCWVPLDQSDLFGWQELKSAPSGTATVVSNGAAGAPDTESSDGEGGASNGGAPSSGGTSSGGTRWFRLPDGVCDRVESDKSVSVFASTSSACLVTKSPKYPTCGPWSSVSQNTDPNAIPTSLHQLEVDFLVTYCQSINTCAGQGDLDGFNVKGEDCTQWAYEVIDELALTTDPWWRALDRAFNQGTVQLKADGWQACLADIRTCQPDACTDTSILAGTITKGGSCFIHDECLDGYCSSSADDVCPGTCKPRLPKGTACSSSIQCETLDGYYTDCASGANGGNEVCTLDPLVTVREGGSCSAKNTLCDTGLVCLTSSVTNKSTCSKLGELHDDCEDSSWCGPNLYCQFGGNQSTGGTCETAGGAGVVCANYRGCEAGLVCADATGAVCDGTDDMTCGKCRTTQTVGDGASCDATRLCDSKQVCTAGVCVDIGGRKQGEACSPGTATACQSGLYCSSDATCQPLVLAGHPCSGDEACESGVCDYDAQAGIDKCAAQYCDVYVTSTASTGAGGSGGTSGTGTGGTGASDAGGSSNTGGTGAGGSGGTSGNSGTGGSGGSNCSGTFTLDFASTTIKGSACSSSLGDQTQSIPEWGGTLVVSGSTALFELTDIAGGGTTTASVASDCSVVFTPPKPSNACNLQVSELACSIKDRTCQASVYPAFLQNMACATCPLSSSESAALN